MRGLLAVAFLALVSCGGGVGGSNRGVGEYCSKSAECAAGTTCIPQGSTSIIDGGPGCDDTVLLCSKTCSVDSDCASLGTGFICLSDCALGSCLMGSRH